MSGARTPIPSNAFLARHFEIVVVFVLVFATAFAVSIGVSEIGGGADAVHVIELADQRMYEQKAAHHEQVSTSEMTWPFRGINPPVA